MNKKSHNRKAKICSFLHL